MANDNINRLKELPFFPACSCFIVVITYFAIISPKLLYFLTTLKYSTFIARLSLLTRDLCEYLRIPLASLELSLSAVFSPQLDQLEGLFISPHCHHTLLSSSFTRTGPESTISHQRYHVYTAALCGLLRKRARLARCQHHNFLGTVLARYRTVRYCLH